MEDFFDAEQLAQAWGMHVRTIRRYIREGKLQARKIGGEWRISKEDAEMFIGGNMKQLKEQMDREVESYLADGRDSNGNAFEVCAVIEYRLGSKEAQHVSQQLIAMMNADDPTRGAAKFQCLNMPEENKSRFVIWGSPGFVGRMLTTIAESKQ